MSDAWDLEHPSGGERGAGAEASTSGRAGGEDSGSGEGGGTVSAPCGPFPMDRESVRFRLLQWLNSMAALAPSLGRVIPAALRRPFMAQGVVLAWQSLQMRTAHMFDGESAEHRALLRKLWDLAFPGEQLGDSLRAVRWKDMGWQRDDPRSDFRGGGLLCLENLVFMAERSPGTFRRLMDKARVPRSEPDYPFAAAGVNVTVLVTDLLGLDKIGTAPVTPEACGFVELLKAGGDAFDRVYCAAMDLLDEHYVAQGSSYMQFPRVVREVRRALSQALARYPQDLPDLVRGARAGLGLPSLDLYDDPATPARGA